MKKSNFFSKLATKKKALSLSLVFLFILSFIGQNTLLKAEPEPVADERDKTHAVGNVNVKEFSQEDNPAENLGELDLDKSFKLKFSFMFKIVKDENIGDYKDIGLESKDQVNEKDFAKIYLGENIKAADDAQLKTPVYEIKTGQKVGVISILNDPDGKTYAKMDFLSDPNDPKGQFNYEPKDLQELIVEFEGMFKALKGKDNHGTGDKKFIKILEKEIEIPSQEKVEKFTLNKSGTQNGLNNILWTIKASRTLDGQKADIAGNKIVDDLSNVGKVVAGSFKINGKAIEDKDIYNSGTKTIEYTFPEGSEGEQVITFETEIPWGDKTEVTVENKVQLIKPKGEPEEHITKVTPSKKPDISKNFQKVEVSLENDEKALLWEIKAGKAGYKYGPTWISDVFLGLENAPKPKRIEITVEKLNAEGKWEKVELDKSLIDADDKPVPPMQKDDPCPAIPDKYTKSEIYDFGENTFTSKIEDAKKNPKKPENEADKAKAEEDAKYKVKSTNWYFLPNLDGIVKISFKQVFAADAVIDSKAIKNTSEIYNCGSYNTPIKPPVFEGVGSITKSAVASGEYACYGKAPLFRQGIFPWNITVNLSKAFVDENVSVYEVFYYGQKAELDANKTKLTLNDEDLAKLPEGTFAKLMKENINVNLAYVKDTFKSTNEEDKLNVDIYPLMLEGKQVGEIVRLHGFKESKTYSLEIQTQIQDFYEKAHGESFYDTGNMSNTAVLATGKADALKLLPATDYDRFDANLFRKTVLNYDVDLNDLQAVWQVKDASYGYIYTDYYKKVDPAKTFNYKDRTSLFRININPFGTNWGQYLKDVKNKPEKMPNYNKVNLNDNLPDDWKLVPVDDSGAMFAVYEASPSELIQVKYSISYGGSPAQKRNLRDPKATRRLSADEVNQLLTFDESKKEWTFNNIDGKSYMVVAKAQLDKAAFEKLTEGMSQPDEAHAYINNAQIQAENELPRNASDSMNVKPELLSKKKPAWKNVDAEGNASLEWTIEHKPYKKNYKSVQLTDVLDENLYVPVNEKGQLDLKNIKVEYSSELNGDGTYSNYQEATVTDAETTDPNTVKASYDAKTHELKFKLPDNEDPNNPRAWRITYLTYLEPLNIDRDTVKNIVKFESDLGSLEARGEWEEQIKDNKAWARLKTYPIYVFQKMAKAEEGKEDVALPGATFELYSNEELVNTKVSRSDGRVIFVNLKPGEYELKETVAPEGYAKIEKTIKFTITADNKLVLSDDNSKGLEGEGSRSNPVLIYNSRKPKETTKETTSSTESEGTTSSTTTSTEPSKPTEPTTPTEPSKPTQPTTPGETSSTTGTTTENTDSTTKSTGSSSSTNASTTKNVGKTGEIISISAIVGLATIVSAAVLILVARKREE